MNQDYQCLKQDLRALGLKRGDSVLVHSSYKSMGGLEGGIETLIDALLAVIGDSGTLLVPTLSYSSVTENSPVFDYVNTPSCVGAVSEFVRNLEDSVRSIHPTHSCAALGAKQDWFTRGHEQDCTPVGVNSPFFKLKEDGGKILMLGCSTRYNTSMHGIEESIPTSYLLNPETIGYTVVLPDKTFTANHHRHYIYHNGFDQRYDRLEGVMDPRFMRSGTIHGAKSWMIDAPQMWCTAREILQKDELFFVERI